MSADNQLRDLAQRQIPHIILSHQPVRLQHIRNALARIKARDLHDVGAEDVEAAGGLLVAGAPEEVQVVFEVEGGERLVETVQRVRSNNVSS